jgi:hypothetical protein
MRLTRVQVQLTETQLRSLRQLSAKSGRSIADLIRQGIDQYLASGREPTREERRERAIRVAGMFASGATDVSADHDRHLADAFKK